MVTEAIISLLTDGGFGAILGTIAGFGEKWVTRKMEFKEKEAERAHIRAMHDLQMKADAAKAEQELIIAQEEGSWKGLVSSFEHDTSISDVHKWVNSYRAAVRPNVTYGLIALTFFNPDIFINLTTTAVTWWFAVRGSASKAR